MEAGNWIKMLNDYAIATVAVAEGGAIVFLFKELLKAQAMNYETAMKIAPVAQKLAECVDVVERLLERARKE